MTFFWQNLEVSDVLATDIVEFLISRKMERFQMMKVMSKLRPIVKVVQTAVSKHSQEKVSNHILRLP